MKKLCCLLLCLGCLLGLLACGPVLEESEKTYAFLHGETKLEIDGEAAGVLSALGDWVDYTESTSCMFTGLDKVYTYSSFEIQTYPVNGKDYIFMINLLDDTVKTEEGIRIGSSKEAVLSAYGEADSQSDTKLTYTGKGMYLEFLFRGTDDTVTDIRYCKQVKQS